MAHRIRRSKTGDGLGLARVHIETWQAAYRGQLPDDFLGGLSQRLDSWATQWERQILDAADRGWTQIVADDADGIVGFATCGRCESDPADPWVGQVYAIYVHPRAWGQGVGRELFAHATDVLREIGYREAVLWVLETNARARRFYEIAGWRTDGATKVDRRGDVELREVRYRAALSAPTWTFPPNTYVILELPSPVAEHVLSIREGERDFFRWSLPAETTVSGSSGTGPIRTSEDPARVYATLDAIAAETAPISASFGPVRRFPNSDVFYLSFVDERPLRQLHERIARSGLAFSDVPFEFQPHVTLRSRSPVTDAEAAKLLALHVPGRFVLDRLGLYQLMQREPPRDRFHTQLCLLHLAELRGRS